MVFVGFFFGCSIKNRDTARCYQVWETLIQYINDKECFERFHLRMKQYVTFLSFFRDRHVMFRCLKLDQLKRTTYLFGIVNIKVTLSIWRFFFI